MKHLSILVPGEQSTMSTFACIVGAYQVFCEANNFSRKTGTRHGFKVELIAANKSHLLNNGILAVKSHSSIKAVKRTDLIIIPASLVRTYKGASKNNKLLIDWVKLQYKQGAEVASMCAGGFMLAATGILNGKTCSTHWALADTFKELYPGVNLQTDQLITDADGIYTNGGAYSFLHLLMYLVEKFYGHSAAVHCSKYFQVDLNRSLQSEFSIFNGYKQHLDAVILKAQELIEDRFQEKISFEKLSFDLAVGRRNFDRRFIRATGLKPLDYLQRVRVESAKRQFETTRKTVNEIMFEVGYNDTKAFREVFSRVTGLSPAEYKSKYNIQVSLA